MNKNPQRTRGRVRRSLAQAVTAVLAAFGLVAASSVPAGALPQEPAFEGLLATVTFDVGGSYLPLPLLCAEDLDIFWYAPGPAADFIWRGIDPTGPTLAYTSRPVRVGGVYTPLVGDCDGDGCDDIFWYAPGPAADHVWYNNGPSGFTARPVNVGGSYRPVVNYFDGDFAADIYWYAPGATRESIWTGVPGRRSFRSAVAPQVTGNYRPMPFIAASDGGGVLWYNQGAGADVITGARAGSTAALFSWITFIPGGFQAAALSNLPLLYAPGLETDYFVVGADVVGNAADLVVAPGSIDDTSLRIGSTPSGPIAVLHGPGPAPDQLLFAPSEPSESASSWSGLADSTGLPGSAGLAAPAASGKGRLLSELLGAG